MDTVLSNMDAALNDVNTAHSIGGTLVLPQIDANTFQVITNPDGTVATWNVEVDGYISDYRAYLTLGAAHLPGEDYVPLFAKVQQNAGQVGSHSFSVVSTYKHWHVKPQVPGHYTWKTFGLPNEYDCDGPCTDMFQSPHEAFTTHRPKCGDGTLQDVDDEFDKIIDEYAKYGPPLEPDDVIYSIQDILDKRSVTEGCGRSYYKCPTRLDHKDVLKHKVRTCTKTYTSADGTEGACLDSEEKPLKYRRCMGHARDHNKSDRIRLVSTHSDKGDGSTEETAENTEQTQTGSTTMLACGFHATPVSGDHFAAACGTTDHSVCDSLDHFAAACGTTDHFACDGSNHAPAGCSLSGHYSCDNVEHAILVCPPDSNGVSCTYQTSYACSPHTHAYPTPAPNPVPTPAPAPTPAPTPESTPTTVACGGNGWTGCTEQVSSENDHYVSSCSNCSNSYWTCRPVHGAVKHEPPRTCARNRCDNTFTLCSRPPCDVNSEWKCQ